MKTSNLFLTASTKEKLRLMILQVLAYTGHIFNVLLFICLRANVPVIPDGPPALPAHNHNAIAVPSFLNTITSWEKTNQMLAARNSEHMYVFLSTFSRCVTIQ